MSSRRTDSRRENRRRIAAVAVVFVLALSGCTAFEGAPRAGGEIGFEDATERSGLDYADVRRGGSGNGNAGVYVADADGDGWEDVLAVGGDRPALFVNREGTFVRSRSFPSFDRQFESAVWVDYDGDGWDDLLLFPRYGEAVALRNDGGTFERDDAGVGNVSVPVGAAAADYDGDGDDDLFVYQYGDWTEGKPNGYFSLRGHVEGDNGNPNLLYENVGGEFRRVADAGIDAERWSLAASFVDLTGDGRPDVHVANDYNNDTVYVNRGDGTFEERLLGGSTARNGMASEVTDANGDGRPDLFVTNIHIPLSPDTVGRERYERLERLLTFVVHSGRTEGNTLLVNRGNGTFEDRADEYGVRDGGWGWEASFADFDNDGDRDLIHATQSLVRIDREDPTYTYPMLFEREGGSFARLDASDRGLGEDDGRGLVTVDYDRDGDADVISANYGSRFTVYENTASNETNWLQFRVVEGDGTTALGATVEVRAGTASSTVFHTSGAGFLSQDPRVSHVGLGSRRTATLVVTWPDGTTRRFERVPANRRVRVTPDGVVAGTR